MKLNSAQFANAREFDAAVAASAVRADYYSTGELIPGHGYVEMMTDTGYRIVGGGFVPFVTVHPRPSVAGLVAFNDGTVYGGAR